MREENRPNNSYISRTSGRPAGRPVRSETAPGRRPNPNGRRPEPQRGRPDSRYGNRGGGRPMPPRRRRRRKLPIPAYVLMAAVAILVIYLMSNVITVVANSGTFCDNVSVNGIQLTKFNKEQGQAYIENLFADRLNTTYTLTYNGRTWTFLPTDINAKFDIGTSLERAWNIGHVGSLFEKSSMIKQLKQFPVDFDIAMSYDEKLVDQLIERIYNDTYVAAQDAVVVVDTDQPYLTGESSIGCELDREGTQELIAQMLEEGITEARLPVNELLPKITSDSMNASLNLIVEYSTDVSFRGYDSRYNVRKALGYFNGMCVSPGETIDFNAIVGDRNEERGWKEATEYAGRSTTKGYGGGVCQASSTLYGAVLKAGMDIIERHAHSMTVSYVSPSLDAAVTSSGKDFIFINNTESPYYIYTEVTKDTATVKIYGPKPQYRYELYSNIVSQDSEAVHKDYIYDMEGKYVNLATDTPVLYKEGRPACHSEGWIISYDWDTGEEVTRKQLSYDAYESGTDIYWVGIHNEDGSVISANNS